MPKYVIEENLSFYDELYKSITNSKNESNSKSKVYFISIDPVYQLK